MLSLTRRYRLFFGASLLLSFGQLFAQTQFNAAAVNSVLNPTYFSGIDIGAKINAAWASGIGKTVRIPAGTYSFSTTINHPGSGYKLECDAGTILDYAGTEDAILLPQSGGSTEATGIDGEGGCLINGTSAGRSGIHLNPSNDTFVRNMRITGFSNGYGIYNTGANSVEISGNNIRANKIGIYLTGSPGFAANAVHVIDNEIFNNSEWGIDSENAHCPCSINYNNVIRDNVVENNGNGIELNWDRGTIVDGNYLSNSGVNLGIGNGLDNVFAISVMRNHFEDSAASPEGISLGYGIGFHFEDNDEIGTSSTTCFINKTYGGSGSDTNIRGIGTNYVYTPGSHEICNHGTPGN